MAVVPGGWSVACEVSFYVVLPLPAWMIGGRIWRAILLTGVAAIVAQVRARHLVLAGPWDLIAYVQPIEQAPVFLFGITPPH